MAGNPDPTVTAVDLPVGSLGTFHATVTTWEMVAVVTSAAQTLNVPSGRYLVTLLISGAGTPAPQTLTWQVDTGAGATSFTIPAQTYRHLRSLTASRSVQVVLDVKRWNGSAWKPYASTGTVKGSVNLPAAAVPAAGSLPLFGASAGLVYGPLSGMKNYVQNEIDGGLQALQDMGMTITRNDPQWMLLQPTSRAMDAPTQAAFDAYFNSCAAKGLKVIVFLEPIITSPTWAASGGVRGNMPANWTDFANYVADFLARWGTNVAAVELINEPNINTYPNGGGGAMPIADYVTCLQHLYTAVKAYSAAMPVLAGCLSMADYTYLTNLYANAGFKGNYDAISVHPYEMDMSPSASDATTWKANDPSIATQIDPYYCVLTGVAKIHEIMRANGEGAVPIWITEVGFHTGRTANIGGKNCGYDVTEAQQATYLSYLVRALSRLPYVAAVHIYAALDTSASAYDKGRFGLVDYHGMRRKPAVAALTSALTGLRAGTG